MGVAGTLGSVAVAGQVGRVKAGARLGRLALLLSAGGVLAALAAAIGSGAGVWHFGTGLTVLRYALFAAIAGALVGLCALLLCLRGGARAWRPGASALLIALPFVGFLGSQIATAKSVPAIHDAATDLADLPRLSTLGVRPDNLERIPDLDRADLAALDPESRWKAIHREAYGDLHTLRLPIDAADARKLAQSIIADRGWAVVRTDPAGDTLEATATTLFFRFKDDVAIRIRSDPRTPGGSLVDMRSISRVGGSDVGVNAQRIRDFLADMRAAAA